MLFTRILFTTRGIAYCLRDAVVRELKMAYDVVVVRRKDARDTSEEWLGVTSVESSVVGESSGQQDARISNVVEVEGVECLPECLPESVRAAQVPSKSYCTKHSAHEKRKRSATPVPTATPKRLFEFDDESIVLPKERGVHSDEPNFEVFLKVRRLLRLAEVVVAVVLHLVQLSLCNCISIFIKFT